MRISSVSCSALMVPVEGTALSIERRALSAANALADRKISFAFSNPVIRFFTFLISNRRLGGRSRLTTGVRYRRASSTTATTGIDPETAGNVAAAG